jgi:hypothetical protein
MTTLTQIFEPLPPFWFLRRRSLHPKIFMVIVSTLQLPASVQASKQPACCLLSRTKNFPASLGIFPKLRGHPDVSWETKLTKDSKDSCTSDFERRWWRFGQHSPSALRRTLRKLRHRRALLTWWITKNWFLEYTDSDQPGRHCKKSQKSLWREYNGSIGGRLPSRKKKPSLISLAWNWETEGQKKLREGYVGQARWGQFPPVGHAL